MRTSLCTIFTFGFLLFVSCVSTPKIDTNTWIIGKWLTSSISGKETNENVIMIWDFRTKSDIYQIFVLNGETVNNPMEKYYIEGDKIFFTNENNFTNIYKFELINQNELKLELQRETKRNGKLEVDGNRYVYDKSIEDYGYPPYFILYKFDVEVSEFQTLEKADSIESVLENASKKIVASLTKGKNIAISNVSAEEKDYSDFIVNELEVILIDAGFIILDRSQLDIIRQEQNLQLSGAVADNEIISIGKFSGASYIITGSIDGTGPTRRLRLRLLDIETARVIKAVSERF